MSMMVDGSFSSSRCSLFHLSKHHIDPWEASTQKIAEFLLHLFSGGKLKVRTIEGYRAAISSSLKLRGRTVGTYSYLSSLIASFYTDRTVELNLMPQWDLSLHGSRHSH